MTAHTQPPGLAPHAPLVWLPRAALHAMREEATRRYPCETGGVVLGYVVEHSEQGAEKGRHGAPDTADGGTVLVVTAVVGPGPRAVHRRATFLPDHDYHAAEVARVYESSGRIWTYLGDWHTHPNAPAYLSATDAETLERIARSPRARTPRPLMIVLGGERAGPAGDRTRCGHGLGDDGQRDGKLDDIDAAGAWTFRAWRYVQHRSLWERARGTAPGPSSVERCRVHIADT